MKTRLVLFGAPGSGKGTQASVISERLGVPSISTGEMLRAAVEGRTALGEKVAGIMASGRLVDDATMAEVVRQRLAEADAQEGFILDGYPRTLKQADDLSTILGEMGWSLDAAIHLQVPEGELIKRALARKRADDREEVIRHRLEVYREQTEPLIEHFDKQGLLLVIDGHQTIDEVAQTLSEALEVVA